MTCTFWFIDAPQDCVDPVEEVDPIIAAGLLDIPVRLCFAFDGIGWLHHASAKALKQIEFLDDVELLVLGEGPDQYADHPVHTVDAPAMAALALQEERGVVSSGMDATRRERIEALYGSSLPLVSPDDPAQIEQLVDWLESDRPVRIWSGHE